MKCSCMRGFSLSLSFGLVAFLAGCPANGSSDVNGGSDFASLSALTQSQPTTCEPGPQAIADISATTVSAKSDGFGYVYLDGTASTAAMPDELSFTWMDNNKEIASGEYIYVRLSTGVHDLKLIVRDYCGNETTDTVRVTVQPQSQ